MVVIGYKDYENVQKLFICDETSSIAFHAAKVRFRRGGSGTSPKHAFLNLPISLLPYSLFAEKHHSHYYIIRAGNIIKLSNEDIMLIICDIYTRTHEAITTNNTILSTLTCREMLDYTRRKMNSGR